MSQIEDIMYSAIRLGITKQMFDRVSQLKKESKHKHTMLSELYSLAFDDITDDQTKSNHANNLKQ